jgi:hypothetical protein
MLRRHLGFAFIGLAATACSTAGSSTTPPANIDQAAITKADGSGGITVDNWQNAGTFFPATLPVAAANYDADNCELYVDQLAAESFSSSGATLGWLDAFVAVNPSQPGTITDVGMYVETTDGDRFVMLGNATAGRTGYYETGFTTVESSAKLARTAKDYAFFVDVQRDDQLVRLWQSDDGYNYLDAAVFAAPPSTSSQGDTSISAANGGSPIYFQKDACQ